jgi:TP53 regulating kinase-like protein
MGRHEDGDWDLLQGDGGPFERHGSATRADPILGSSLFALGVGHPHVLSNAEDEIEAQGVDLHLLKRALQSTHFQFWEECFSAVLCGYTSVRGVEPAEKVYEKTREIERRGRYVEERRQ